MSKLKLVLQKISKRKFNSSFAENFQRKNSTQVLQRIFCQKCSWWLNQQVNETSVETNKHSKFYWAIFSKKRLKIRPPLGSSQEKRGQPKTTTFGRDSEATKKFFCFQTAHQNFQNPESAQFRWPILVFLGQKEKRSHL